MSMYFFCTVNNGTLFNARHRRPFHPFPLVRRSRGQQMEMLSRQVSRADTIWMIFNSHPTISMSIMYLRSSMLQYRDDGLCWIALQIWTTFCQIYRPVLQYIQCHLHEIKVEVQNYRNISQFGGQKWAVLKELLPGDLCLTSQEDADYVHSMFSIIGLVSLALNL